MHNRTDKATSLMTYILISFDDLHRSIPNMFLTTNSWDILGTSHVVSKKPTTATNRHAKRSWNILRIEWGGQNSNIYYATPAQYSEIKTFFISQIPETHVAKQLYPKVS